MSTAITPFEPQSLEEAKGLAQTLAKSALIPGDLKSRPEDVFVMLLTGRELGLAPMQAIRSISVIKGKPVLSAELIAALVMRSPACEYLMLVASDDKSATYEAKRKGAPKPVTLSWSVEQAKQAGLAGGGSNWQRHPAAMCRARCVAAICRAVFPDVVLGVLEEGEAAEIRERQVPAAIDPVVAERLPKPAPAPEPKPAAEQVVEVAPIPAKPPEAQPPAQPKVRVVDEGSLEDRINRAADGAELAALAGELKAHVEAHPEQADALRAAYAARKKAIGGGK